MHLNRHDHIHEGISEVPWREALGGDCQLKKLAETAAISGYTWQGAPHQAIADALEPEPPKDPDIKDAL